MDPGQDPVDHDEIIQRYSRRLFLLAYHLSGDAAEAAALSRECLVRSLLAPDLPSEERGRGIYLHRGLISLWRERLEPPGAGAAPDAGARSGVGGRAQGPVSIGGRAKGPPAGRVALWRALSRLDPVSRAVFVLRVAEGLEYETIGKVLDMAPDVVYARLLQARGGLREGDRGLEASLFETMNLYLDGRLSGDRRAAFEKRLRTDAALRGRVEFHRGLSLELLEEAPSLPRDFVDRLHERLDQGQETMTIVDRVVQAVEPEADPPPGGTGSPALPERRPPAWPILLVAAVIILVVGVALGLWAGRKRQVSSSSPEPGRAEASSEADPTPDEATIEALRSLGYLAPGKPVPTPGTSRRSPAPPAGAPSPDAAVPWRVLAVARAPEPGSDHKVIRTEREWSALFEGTGEAPPEVSFEKEMVVLLPDRIPGVQPERLVVRVVRSTPAALLIECRKERAGSSGEATTPASRGQAIVLPISDLPVQILIR